MTKSEFLIKFYEILSLWIGVNLDILRRFRSHFRYKLGDIEVKHSTENIFPPVA